MAIGETVLGVALQVVIDRLASEKVLNFFCRSKFDQTPVRKLVALMLAAEKLLLDAEQKQLTDCAVRQWLEELKHWFYRAEEVSDQIATEALQSSLEMDSPLKPESLVTKVRNWTLAFSTPSSFLKTVSLTIREIVHMLESMLNQKDALGLRELSVVRAPQRVPTTCLLEDLKVYGRDLEREKILEFLLYEDAETNRFNVFAIVGMGGVGKTTLAKTVYNDARVQEAFDLKAWVCVSDPFDISRVTKSILESVTRQSYSGSLDLDFIQTELSGKLRDKKFLFILDDAWNENYEDWGTLQAPFHASANGSKIIITTRNDEVASSVCTKTPFPLKPLLDDDAWSLFTRHAFELGIVESNPCLKRIGRKVVEKCKGLPLAIKTLGGLLRWRHNSEDWDDILQSSLWDLPYDKSNVIPALWLSYFHLPGHLKRCFSYCAIFPKDYKIDRKQVVLLWMAENFVPSTNHNKRRMEDVGNEYLCQLVSRSFLEPMDESHVTMHDLMHDLAEGLSGNFLARPELESTSKISKRARHFSYVAGFYDVKCKFEVVQETTFLRTFLQLHATQRFSYLTNEVSIVLKPSLSCLRVLSLSGYENIRLTELIECPTQLRYLDVSRTTINQLPEWASTLCNLQTLILSDCTYLETLPADMWRLVSLRHLDIRGATMLSAMPKQMSKLKGLQTLTDFVVGNDSGSGIQELGELQQIRGKFAIRRLQNVTVPCDAYVVDLSHRRFIDDLELEFDPKENNDSQKDRKVLENLKPPLDVKRLTIRNYAGTTFPNWLDLGCVDYENLGFVCLSNCRYCITIPPLGQLPSLKKLDIRGMDYIIEVGCEFYGNNNSGPFPALESLHFENMKTWEVWSNPGAGDGAVCFPRLKHLFLDDCPNLKGDLPVHVPSLMELKIKGCAFLSGLPPQVPSIDVLQLTACPRVELASACRLTSITRLSFVRLVQLVNLPPEVVMFSSLNDIEIQDCDNLSSLAKVQMPHMLKSLTIEGCKVMEFLPKGMEFLTHLRKLKVSGCQCLRWLPGNNLPTSLTSISVSDCERWEFPIPTERMQHYTSLESLWLECQGIHLVSFPLGIFPNLHVLRLCDCMGLEKVYIPEGIQDDNLTSLTGLTIEGCPRLKMIGKETGRGEATVLTAPNLTGLLIEECEKVKPVLIEIGGEVLLPKLGGLRIDKSNKVTSQSPLSLKRSLCKFSCLTFLSISDEQVECFPVADEGWGSLPTSLTELWIVDSPKLKKLDGRALLNLRYLQEFYIRDCPQLECLPKEGLPPSLGLLSIEGCPMVEERCQPEKGYDWSLIHHLPYIEINGCCITCL